MKTFFKQSLAVVLLFSLICFSKNAHAEYNIADSVVKIIVTSNPMDYSKPWQAKGVSFSSGSGSIIEGHKILTNAHVISDETFIQVKKHNDSKKYTAEVYAVNHECDLAILTVKDENFFKNTKPIEFGELPKLKDSVSVLGYPQGGGKISVTEGVVSREEVIRYSQSGRHFLAVQIDAAINPGNSGGPVLKDGKLVGVAMQHLVSGQNIGYIIPTPIIEHFFKDMEDGHIDGFPLLGIEFDNTENKTLRNYYKISDVDGGIIVNRVMPYSPAYGTIFEQDVILQIDGIDIGEDGTFKFREDERLLMTYLITAKQVNDSIDFKIIRNGEIKNISVVLKPFEALVPYSHELKKPPYYIYGGMVFTVLSTDFLKSWGNKWWEKAPIDLAYYLVGTGRMNWDKAKDKVVLLGVLPDDINAGYHDSGNLIITKVNGKDFLSFEEFVKLVNKSKHRDEYTFISSENNARFIIKNENIDKIENSILKRNSIPKPYSQDVEKWISE